MKPDDFCLLNITNYGQLLQRDLRQKSVTVHNGAKGGSGNNKIEQETLIYFDVESDPGKFGFTQTSATLSR